jgi:hypothetical protein
VQFDGHTPAGGFAVWYWSGDALSESRKTSLVDLHCGGEEFQAALAQFSDSALMSSLTIKSIQRVQNDERRLVYDLQRRVLEKKVTAPPRSMRWNPRTMERWAFHAPGCGRGRVGEDASGAALPWECIVEEGFHASLAGSENGSVYGAGIYFAKDAALSHQYAQKTAYMAASRQGHASRHASEKVCRVFLTRIATGLFTAGHNGMNQPRIDAAGAKGEHFHSLVDNPHNPMIFVVNDNTRAYPAYLVTYESSTSVSGMRQPGAVQNHPALLGVSATLNTPAPFIHRGSRTMQTGPMRCGRCGQVKCSQARCNCHDCDRCGRRVRGVCPCAPPAGQSSYTTQEYGETLSTIAKHLGLDVDCLMKRNCFARSMSLKSGTVVYYDGRPIRKAKPQNPMPSLAAVVAGPGAVHRDKRKRASADYDSGVCLPCIFMQGRDACICRVGICRVGTSQSLVSGKRGLSEDHDKASAKKSSSSSPPRPVKRQDPSLLVVDVCSDSD